MAIERQYGKIIFTCDVEKSPRCDESVETEERDFQAALAAMKKEGWTVHRAGSGFMHCCTRCPVPR